MHLHIVGICGTFMTGVALLARENGHKITGSDESIYPPMSDVLERSGISVFPAYSEKNLRHRPDTVIIGNALSRGNPEIEACLSEGIPYLSGPEWLAREVLNGKWVIGVAGTHGKTTTSSMCAWILRQNGLDAGYLIGGLPVGLEEPASLGTTPFFVVEADEYDSAFFDKRPKFLHYRPRTLILGNLEFDHADIFSDLEAIKTQFHHLIRTVPANGLIIQPSDNTTLDETLALGVWTQTLSIGLGIGDIQGRLVETDGSAFLVSEPNGTEHLVEWPLLGKHNVMNALAAIAATRHAGIPPAAAASALCNFEGVHRRLELLGMVGGISVYDDFAHHPSAIATTLAALQSAYPKGRVLAVLELRSNTMRAGIHHSVLANSLVSAHLCIVLRPPGSPEAPLNAALAPLGKKAFVESDVAAIVDRLACTAQRGDHVVIMSNGSFENIHQRLLARLAVREVES